MGYVKVNTDNSALYPYSQAQLVSDNPDTSFPSEVSDRLFSEWGVYPVRPTELPPYNKTTHKLVEITPTQIAGQWVQVWDLVPLTAEELQAAAREIQVQIVDATQKRLDDFAHTRNYDSILSACTYATSTVAKFQAEGQYCVEARDATWAKLYEVLAEVEAGARPVPTGFGDIEPELPVLEWPQ